MTPLASARPRALTAALLFAAGSLSIGAAFFGALPASAAGCTSGSLIKGPMAAVYYCGADGKRYVFADDKTYFTWYSDFSNIQPMTAAELGDVTIGGNVTYRPGRRMVKIQSDPRTYVVSRGGVLRHVPSEECAKTLYGADWNRQIDDVSDAFFVNYRVGEALSTCSDYDRNAETSLGTSINADKSLSSSGSAGAPWITMTTPSSGASSVGLASELSATFGSDMRASTLTPATFTLTKSGSSSAAVAGTVSMNGRVATFRPNAALEPNATYRAVLTTGALDATGRAMASDHAWTFTTGSASGSNPTNPGTTSITSISPPDGGAGVAAGTPISVTFSGPMTASTVDAQSVRLMRGDTAVAGTVSMSGNVATFTPSSALQPGTSYTVRVENAVRDASGAAVTGSPVSWSFTTAP